MKQIELYGIKIKKGDLHLLRNLHVFCMHYHARKITFLVSLNSSDFIDLDI